MATAAVLSIGTELTRGELVNTNATFLAEALTRIGFEVVAIETVDDDAERIQAALGRLSACNVIVSTGGLGPTTDDITTACVAERLGLPLERDAASLEHIRERLARFGRELSPSNAKQADFPRGASVLPNPNGTAPGFSIAIGRALAFFMPGVPREMRSMFDASVAPVISALVDRAQYQIRLKTHGLAESEVNDRLAGVENQYGVTIGYRATFPVIEVKLLARDASAEEAERRSRAAAEETRRRLGDEIVFGEGEDTFAEALGRELVERRWRLSAAESCTGGLVGELLTAKSGASEFFVGSAVVYDNAAKSRLLGIDPALIARHGAVSREVARAMAEGALGRFETDIALAITGIAGPFGGSDEKPVGLVHYAVSTRDGTTDKSFVFPGPRDFVRTRAAYAALGLVRRILRRGHPTATDA